MDNTKAFYHSKTYLWLVPLISLLLYKVWGVEISEMELAQLMESLVLLIGMIIVAYGRLKASHKLTLLPKKK